MKYLKYILILTMVVSCQKGKVERPKKPDNLIGKEKMVDVLYDMALISAAKGINKKLLENKGIQPDTYIYTKHNIDSTQFATSNAYYAFSIKDYQELFDKVKARLQSDKDGFNATIEFDKKKRDSTIIANKTRDSLKRANRNKKDVDKPTERPRLLQKADSSQQLKPQ